MNALRKNFIALTLVSFSLMAKAEIINVQTASQPSGFHVVAKSECNTCMQSARWNIPTTQLETVGNLLEIKGGSNSISVHLSAVPQIGSNSHFIPLEVNLDKKIIPVGSTLPLEINNANGREFSLTVTPVSDETIIPGAYIGTVEIVFEPTVL
ncbi:hypothetical protein [Pantoea sp. SOD02]|uniref:hypothetical protein n=1 Tax=Pantoea sp. SOD02 TaxID=2970818 RepID=UPI00215722A1|nr:hypothetical protein [Pantoea sp. SOD02]UVC32091.1 hypothetical protein NR302_21230 [Pantoea sp. SOD02]